MKPADIQESERRQKILRRLGLDAGHGIWRVDEIPEDRISSAKIRCQMDGRTNGFEMLHWLQSARQWRAAPRRLFSETLHEPKLTGGRWSRLRFPKNDWWIGHWDRGDLVVLDAVIDLITDSAARNWFDRESHEMPVYLASGLRGEYFKAYAERVRTYISAKAVNPQVKLESEVSFAVNELHGNRSWSQMIGPWIAPDGDLPIEDGKTILKGLEEIVASYWEADTMSGHYPPRPVGHELAESIHRSTTEQEGDELASRPTGSIWSKPLTKKEIARCITGDKDARFRTIEGYVERLGGVIQVSERNFIMRLDLLSPDERLRFRRHEAPSVH